MMGLKLNHVSKRGPEVHFSVIRPTSAIEFLRTDEAIESYIYVHIIFDK